MPNLGPGEILMILLVALLVFGPRKLPELGKSLGAGLREFRRSTQGLKEEFDLGLRDADNPEPVQPGVTRVIASVPAQPVTVERQPVSAQAVIPQPSTPAEVKGEG